MRGISTKSGIERGYGVRSSKDIVRKALKGEFVYLSGSVSLVSIPTKERLVSLPGFYWRGVIIAYRIPTPKKAIEITPFLE